MITRFLLSVLAAALLMDDSLAVPPLPRVAEGFEVNGRPAVLYAAPEPAAGRPWVWYAPSLNGSLSLRQRKLYYESFLHAGIGIAGYDLGEVRGSPASTTKFTAFYEAMVRRGFSPKPILLGQSRGGMMMLAWATAHPDKVGAFVGIYPVCNLASWPLKRSKAATLADFGLPEKELMAKLKQFNPVDNLSGLAKQRVPMFIVHGDSDVAVPLEENSGLLRDRYRAAGGAITVKVIPNEGHRVCPAFFECRELVDFVLTQSPVRPTTNKVQPSVP
jgi:predicted esterase